MRPRSLLVLVAALGAALAVAPAAEARGKKRGAARATPADEVREITRIDRQAMAAYDLLDAARAKSLLEKALRRAEAAGVAPALLARLHVHLAIVRYHGLDDVDGARDAARAAVRADPAVELDAAYFSRELAALLDESRRAVRPRRGEAKVAKSSAKPVIPEPSPADCKAVRGLDHEPLPGARAGEDTTFAALLGTDLDAVRVALYVKTRLGADYVKYTLEAKGCRYAVTVPAAALRDTSFDYYLAAIDVRGQTLASVGSRGSPIHVVVEGTPRGPDLPAWLDDDSIYYTSKRGIRPGSRDDEGGGGLAAFSIGSGGGYATGLTELADREVSCCFSPAPLHLRFELGYRFSEQTSLSVDGRVGFPLRADLPSHPKLALAAQLKVRRALVPRGDGFGLVGSAGWGVLRQTVTLSPAVQDGSVDTTAIGPLLLGAGVSYVLGTGHVRLLAEAQTILGLPVGFVQVGDARVGLGVHLDVSLGVMAAF